MKPRILPSLAIVLIVAFSGLFSLAAYAQMGDQEPSADQSSLIEALQKGGYVVYMRHGDTTGEPLDRTKNLNNRALQRNLSDDGRAQAKAIGDAIRRLELQVGHVATSPVFRARDTAELAFGADQVEIDQWLIADDYVSGGYRDHLSMLGQYLSTPPERGNTWLVGHVVSIAMLTSSMVDRPNFPEGAAAVFRPENNQFRLVGILGSGWQEIEQGFQIH